MTKILVTGGAGYLGSILTKKLLAKGYQVKLMDTLWYGDKSIKEHIGNQNFELVNADIRNLISTVKAMKGIDGVIHLASIVGMPASSIEPKSSEEINYLATKNIAELCQLHNIDTYIFASTCSVYGSQPGNNLITEKSNVAPFDFYAKQKYLSERSSLWLNKAPTIVRFGTLFGLSPRMRFDLVINLFIAQALKEKKITVFGGDQYRPFLHVDDAAESLIVALEKNLTGTYNVMSENMTMLEAGQKISQLSGCEVIVSKENEDKRNYKVSGEKFLQVGFKPEKGLEYAFNEIKDAFSNGEIENFKDKIYNNYEFLFSSKEIQEKVFILGIPGSLNVP
jgi:nucleoside-diphosphate-sugar epimerase